MSYIDQITVGSTTYDIKDSNAVTSVNGATGSVVITAASIGALPTTTTYVSSVNGSSGAVTLSIPSDTSDLTNGAGYITGIYIASYGNSTYADVLAAYQANKVVYCRAASGDNPSSGSQKRMAFLAYVNDSITPTEFEFQYYRSVATHSDEQQGDQVFVYKLNSSGTWSITRREAYTKIAVGTGLSSSYSSGILTINNSQVITFFNTSVPSSTFSSDNTYTDYPYRGSISLASVESSMIPEVVFNLNEAVNGKFAPISETYDGGIYIYSSSMPSSTIEIPTIICLRGN